MMMPVRVRMTVRPVPRFYLNARRVRLTNLAFRPNERFLYEYDFGDLWQLEVRIERRVSIAPRRTYPMCIGGRWGGPPEDCGGPEAFLEQRDAAPWRVHELLGRKGVQVGYTTLRRFAEKELGWRQREPG